MFKKYSFHTSFVFFISSLLLFSKSTFAQSENYRDSLIAYQQDYVATHGVVKEEDRKYIHFYPIDEKYRMDAGFDRINDSVGFEMNTSSGMKKKYFKYGILTFAINDSVVHLNVYQSEELMKQDKFREYLFVPFGDATSGFESYGGGKYLEFYISDIKENHLVVDFNKAYNPYCAYTSGYNCPLPPVENLLGIAIPAGEKNYEKPFH